MMAINLSSPELYINRELSALSFNLRVFQMAQDHALPLLERLRFLFICCSNLDEFFEVRVAGLKDQLLYEHQKVNIDGMNAQETLKQLSERTHQFVDEIYALFNKELFPALRKSNIMILEHDEWSADQAAWVKNYFRTEILPIISPIGLDLAHPFPRLVNKSLNYLVSLTGKDAFGRDSGLAVVHAPRSIPRVIRLPDELSHGKACFVLLNAVVYAHAGELFGGMNVTGCYQFRVTRNSDLLVDEDHTDNLALALKTGLFARRYGMAVRLEVSADCPEQIAKFLLEQHKLSVHELYRVNGPVNLSRFSMLLALLDNPELRYPSFSPGLADRLQHKNDLFEVIRHSDVLLHHPYQSFSPVLDFIRQATVDNDVLAIKVTLYRVEANSPMANALIEAARAGKQVTAVIELRARFDEEHNIELATQLQEGGALVVYGVVGFKTHAKMILVVRREGKSLRRYAHLGTGNYHAVTAHQYTDFSYFTYNQDITHDVNEIFQQLTGMGKASKLKKLLQSPFTLFKGVVDLIHFEIEQAKQKKPAHIILKLNALTEPQLIKMLYEASQVGVKIELIIRGICALRPQVKGVSENIVVRSVIGRFLEHSRLYYFYHGGDEKAYCASADWMERNMFHRVEVAFPIEDKDLLDRLKEEALDLSLKDNIGSFTLKSDGTYHRFHRHEHHHPLSAQQALLDKHAF